MSSDVAIIPNKDNVTRKRTDGNIYNKARVCKWCGSEFIARYKNSQYCNDTCRYEAKKEHDRLRQRKRYMLYKDLLKSDNLAKNLGSGWLSVHKQSDDNLELKAVQNEFKRLGLKHY